MRFEVTFRNTQTTDALLQRAERKFSKVAKHLREPVEAHLVVQVEKHRHMAEMTVTTGRETLKVQDETDDMYRTIDRVMHKLERIARRAKERQQDRWHAPSESEADGFTLAEAAHEVEEEDFDYDEAPMTEELPKA